MIEVPQQDQKVTWRASLLYHPAEEDSEQTFSRVKTHSEGSRGARTRESLLLASRVWLCSPSTMDGCAGNAFALGVIPLLEEKIWFNLSGYRCKRGKHRCRHPFFSVDTPTAETM